ncbi:MAG: hypothetical protein K9H49_09805 [Bacteroidales bacterium]|nr:hypothetical protein [Bacteroidales bacterium]MCF8389645.1 hypothetical protein [Bacteroidales bacterium]
MKAKTLIQSMGGVAKEENLFTLESHIMPNTFVLENEEPYPGYHGMNLPTDNKPISIFLMTKNKHSVQKIMRLNQKIKKYFNHPFDAVPGEIWINNDKIPCIRIRNLDNYDLVGDLQKCFYSEGILFQKKRTVRAEGVITLKKVFNLEVLEDDILKDLDDDSTFYFRLPKQLSYQEFVAVIKNLRNNIASEKTNFDAALAAIYTKEILDVVRIYAKGASLAFLAELRGLVEIEIKRLD